MEKSIKQTNQKTKNKNKNNKQSQKTCNINTLTLGKSSAALICAAPDPSSFLPILKTRTVLPTARLVIKALQSGLNLTRVAWSYSTLPRTHLQDKQEILLKGHWTSLPSFPNFPPPRDFYIIRSVGMGNDCMLTAEFYVLDWLTFEEIWIFLAFSIFQCRLQ